MYSTACSDYYLAIRQNTSHREGAPSTVFYYLFVCTSLGGLEGSPFYRCYRSICHHCHALASCHLYQCCCGQSYHARLHFLLVVCEGPCTVPGRMGHTGQAYRPEALDCLRAYLTFLPACRAIMSSCMLPLDRYARAPPSMRWTWQLGRDRGLLPLASSVPHRRRDENYVRDGLYWDTIVSKCKRRAGLWRFYNVLRAAE